MSVFLSASLRGSPRDQPRSFKGGDVGEGSSNKNSQQVSSDSRASSGGRGSRPLFEDPSDACRQRLRHAAIGLMRIGSCGSGTLKDEAIKPSPSDLGGTVLCPQPEVCPANEQPRNLGPEATRMLFACLSAARPSCRDSMLPAWRHIFLIATPNCQGLWSQSTASRDAATHHGYRLEVSSGFSSEPSSKSGLWLDTPLQMISV